MRNRASWATVCYVALLAGICLGSTTSCTGGEPSPPLVAAGAQEASGKGYDGPCIPYGMEPKGSTVLDPALGRTPAPASDWSPTPLPTCTPGRTTPTITPGPSPTPLPTSVSAKGGGPALRVSSSPQNITLSPYSEDLGRVAAAPRMRAVTWDHFITIFTGGGTKSVSTEEVLGVKIRAGVGISPHLRIHVAGGGRYSYSDDGGVSWAAPSSSPVGKDPFVVVGPDGYAWALWDNGDLLRASHQRSNSDWEAPISLGPSGGDYDAVRTDNAVVVISAAGQVHRLPGGPVASLAAANRVDLVYGKGELIAGLARADGRAVIARSLDGGHSWSECLVQNTRTAVLDVAAVPTTQGPYAVVWARDSNYFPSVMLSKAHWIPGQACGVWPEQNQVDQLEVPFIGAPRMFDLACPQKHFRVDSAGRIVTMAFSCIDDSGAPDIFVTTMSTDGFFSGPALGGSREGEEAQEDYYQ